MGQVLGCLVSSTAGGEISDLGRWSDLRNMNKELVRSVEIENRYVPWGSGSMSQAGKCMGGHPA